MLQCWGHTFQAFHSTCIIYDPPGVSLSCLGLGAGSEPKGSRSCWEGLAGAP